MCLLSLSYFRTTSLHIHFLCGVPLSWNVSAMYVQCAQRLYFRVGLLNWMCRASAFSWHATDAHLEQLWIIQFLPASEHPGTATDSHIKYDMYKVGITKYKCEYPYLNAACDMTVISIFGHMSM